MIPVGVEEKGPFFNLLLPDSGQSGFSKSEDSSKRRHGKSLVVSFHFASILLWPTSTLVVYKWFPTLVASLFKTQVWHCSLALASSMLCWMPWDKWTSLASVLRRVFTTNEMGMAKIPHLFYYKLKASQQKWSQHACGQVLTVVDRCVGIVVFIAWVLANLYVNGLSGFRCRCVETKWLETGVPYGKDQIDIRNDGSHTPKNGPCDLCCGHGFGNLHVECTTRRLLSVNRENPAQDSCISGGKTWA